MPLCRRSWNILSSPASIQGTRPASSLLSASLPNTWIRSAFIRRELPGTAGRRSHEHPVCHSKRHCLYPGGQPTGLRTVPLVSKVCNISMARIATQLMLGKKLADLDIKQKSIPHFGVKEAVFPFNMFPEVDPILGPEMRSTGEVLGWQTALAWPFTRPRRRPNRPFLSGHPASHRIGKRQTGRPEGRKPV